jgi:superfamily II DNA helicase RecQ
LPSDSDQNNIALDGLNDMVKYCITPICRKMQIVTYFDNEEGCDDTCNKSCDVCMSKKNVTPINSIVAARELVHCLEEMQKVHQKSRQNYWV